MSYPPAMILTDKQFWDIVAKIDWARDTDSGRVRHDLKEILQASSLSTEIFEDMVRQKFFQLWALVADREKNTWRIRVPGGFISEDGMNDCCNHIVGLGREAFEKALTDVKHIVDRYLAHDFEESFSYVFVEEDEPALVG